MIRTFRAEGKKGDLIGEEKYEILKSYLLRTIKSYAGIEEGKLYQEALHLFEFVIEEDTEWHIETVLLDLEARGLIQKEKGKFFLKA